LASRSIEGNLIVSIVAPPKPKRDWSAVVARLDKEAKIKLAEAAKLVPCDRGRRGYASIALLVKWIVKGKRGAFLDGVRCGPGTTWFTSREAIRRFFAVLSEIEANRAGGIETAADLSPSELERKAKRARDAWEKERASR